MKRKKRNGNEGNAEGSLNTFGMSKGKSGEGEGEGGECVLRWLRRVCFEYLISLFNNSLTQGHEYSIKCLSVR